MENSKIEWTNHTQNLWSHDCMVGFVARLTKSQTIINLKPEARKLGKGFDMVSIQIAAFFIPTFLAGEFIPTKYIKTPTLIITAKSLISALTNLSVFIGMALVSFGTAFAQDHAYFFSYLQRVPFTFHRGFPTLSTFRQKLFSFLRMALALKRAYSAFMGLVRPIYPCAFVTFCSKTITSAIIYVKRFSGLPLLTGCTPLFGLYSTDVLIKIHTNPRSRNLLYT